MRIIYSWKYNFKPNHKYNKVSVVFFSLVSQPLLQVSSITNYSYVHAAAYSAHRQPSGKRLLGTLRIWSLPLTKWHSPASGSSKTSPVGNALLKHQHLSQLKLKYVGRKSQHASKLQKSVSLCVKTRSLLQAFKIGL